MGVPSDRFMENAIIVSILNSIISLCLILRLVRQLQQSGKMWISWCRCCTFPDAFADADDNVDEKEPEINIFPHFYWFQWFGYVSSKSGILLDNSAAVKEELFWKKRNHPIINHNNKSSERNVWKILLRDGNSQI